MIQQKLEALVPDTKRIWVLIEQEESKPHPVSWELLGAAQRLAAELPGCVVEGVLLGHNVGQIPPEAFRCGGLAADFSKFTGAQTRIDPAGKRTNAQGRVLSVIGHEGATMIKVGDKYVHLGTAWSTDSRTELAPKTKT